MDSRIGLDFIVENPDYIRKLVSALDTDNTTVKTQVFELLSALCVHNSDGHARALNTLEDYKKLKGGNYRLSFIVEELDRSNNVQYQTALLAFINCLIISTPKLNDRSRLRNEFIGCHLLSVLNKIRKKAEIEPELAVQLDVFDEQRVSDDNETVSKGPHGLDLNSPLDVFYAILKQVAETPQEIPFLSILHHLLRIDPKEAISDIIWDTAERLVHRATLLENKDDVPKLLRQQSRLCHCQQRSSNDGSKRQSLVTLSPEPNSCPPPPPPPPFIPQQQVIPPPAPAPPPSPPKQQQTLRTDNVKVQKLPQQEIPAPKMKMKTINWIKIPSNKVVGKNNIWTQVAGLHNKSPIADMDWSEMEGLFCQQAPPSPKLRRREISSGADVTDRPRPRKDVNEITLLDGKRSLNVNIFLKQFRSSNENIIHLIKEGVHEEIGNEKLKGLLKILPELDEIEMLKNFDGDFFKLGNAEKFLIKLINLSNYKLRIESMLLKEEFASNMSYLLPSIKSMKLAAQDLMTNKLLQEVLYMILVAGNFLNAGGYAGDAAGVKLSSLQNIIDIRANKPNMKLIHFVALQAEKKDVKLLSFTENISLLEDAARSTLDQLNNEIKALNIRINKIKKQISSPNTEMEIKLQMKDFLLYAEEEVGNVQRCMIELDNIRLQLSDFFCEDSNTFKLEECFRVFHSFYCGFKQAIVENERRKLQEEQALARRKQREELLAIKRKQMQNMTRSEEDDTPFIDLQLKNSFIKKGRRSNTNSEDEQSINGSPLSRRRLGSFNENGEYIKDKRSPETTPNGSLRRRTSRVLSEEDEVGLMDFLRYSGNENTRERKSWGSLDRSWARKIRGNGTRKRTALLTADFSQDRERPSSPSPMSECEQNLTSTTESETQQKKPKEWRQKIESWLKGNNDEIIDDTKRQIKKLNNRRSFEMDSESSTLDTLPEGKQVYQTTYKTKKDNTDDSIKEIKDKSAWRKSTLNVANSTEEITEDKSRLRLRDQINDVDNERKTLIAQLGAKDVKDTLTLYIRQPIDNIKKEEKIPKRIKTTQNNIDQITNNKIDIDQDNIETPPTIRKIFIPSPIDKREPVPPIPCRRMLNRKDSEDTLTIGDGHFDRYSAARRTRRYKRNTDIQETSSPPELIVTDIKKDNDDDDVTKRLKLWQNKLELKEKDEKNNDEGFEETQSLMSESPCQGTSSSGGNYERDNPVTYERSTNQKIKETLKTPIISKKRELERTTNEKNKRIEKDNGRLIDNGTKYIKNQTQEIRKPTTPIRPMINTRIADTRNLLLKKSNKVQRSNSRNSIVSSKSSLNSCTSTNTVKRIPLKKTIPITTTINNKKTTNINNGSVTKRVTAINNTTNNNNNTNRPPRSQNLSFMKPTTSSATKINVVPNKSTFRHKI